MGAYTLEKHLNNIGFLQNVKWGRKGKTEIEMFSLINSLADFIQENNEYYCCMNNFNTVTDLLVDIINFSNNNQYEFISFQKQYNLLAKNVIKMKDDILKTYNINVYFKGKDKYDLFQTIINPNISYEGYLKVNKSSNKTKNKEFNILIISEETYSLTSVTLGKFDTIIYYDRFMNDMFNKVEQIYFHNHIYYDYNYLVNSINKAKENVIDTIIIGHSYSLNGIDEEVLNEKMVNLSLSSQDLYYSFQIAKEIIDENTSIKNCYIGTSYWSFYLDLSMAKNVNELARIENIYYPILKDSHNCKHFKMNEISLYEYPNQLYKQVFDLNKLYSSLSKIIFLDSKTYFNDKVKRETISQIGKNKLCQMNEELKYKLGKEQAELHNKLIKYTHTKYENIEIIKEFMQYLNKKDINTVVVNFPTSKYYNNYLNKQFKEEYYEIFESLKGTFNFQLIDLEKENNLFIDEDYRDFNHLSQLGSEKVSRMLNEKLMITKK